MGALMNIRIVLADDHKIVREGLRNLIGNQKGMEVVGEAGDGREAVRLVSELAPDVVIMDVAMPGLNGIEATRQIVSKTSGPRVIALSMHSDRRFVAEMLHAGASGYLLKDCAFEEIVAAIRSVSQDKIYLSPGVSDILVRDYVRLFPATEFSPLSILTPREREVLQLLAEGKSTREMASSLEVSVKTVETFRQQLMDKLDIHTVAELTKYAIREGLTALES
jgi:DNA-binding NarL/FixJ family response regulator